VDAIHIVARVALGAVFVVAGSSKVAIGRVWPTQAAQLGVPRRLALIVPWFELVVGALVLVGIARPWPEIVALVTLVVFTAVVWRTLHRGERPPCACFGAWSASPLGWSHVARNVAFAVLAGVSLLSG
jgi:uncharacterized membrane protein YphA (DoxX/SURF4 family)